VTVPTSRLYSRITPLLIAVAVVVCPATARAGGGLGHPIQIGIGAYFPTASNSQQLIHTVYDVDASYDFTHGSFPVSVYGGYGWGSHSPISGATLSYSSYWLGVEGRTADQLYAGLGVGYYGQSGTVSVTGLGSASGSTGGVGGTAFVGYDLGPRGSSGVGIRAGYNFLPTFAGANTDGWGVTLTYRI